MHINQRAKQIIGEALGSSLKCSIGGAALLFCGYTITPSILAVGIASSIISDRIFIREGEQFLNFVNQDKTVEESCSSINEQDEKACFKEYKFLETTYKSFKVDTKIKNLITFVFLNIDSTDLAKQKIAIKINQKMTRFVLAGLIAIFAPPILLSTTVLGSGLLKVLIMPYISDAISITAQSIHARVTGQAPLHTQVVAEAQGTS
jgi:hypothetical protein